MSDLPELMARLRDGDGTAAAELEARFGPQLRRAIRVRLVGSKLRRVMDSEDLLQSVFLALWRERDGVKAEQPGQLFRWLVTVAENRVAEHGRRGETAKRGGGRADAGSAALAAAPDGGVSPLSEVATRDLLQRVLDKLGPEWRRIAEAREANVPWEDLASQEGTTAEALRKRFCRAVKELGDL